jgi:transposase InsO family protein
MVRRVTQDGESPQAVATAWGLSPKTVRKWVKRALARPGVICALKDHSSRPRRSPTRTKAALRKQVIALRRQRFNYGRIATELGLSKPTICRILRKEGLNRLKSLDPIVPVIRYERDTPGDLLHFDIKKLGRIDGAGHRVTGKRMRRKHGPGWEYLHVVIDDHTRIAYAAVLPTERKSSAVPFLKASLVFFAALGVRTRQVMTDNGACYRSNSFARTCNKNGIQHIFTRPYTPRTNGKAERFIQTICREWAYAHSYDHSKQRTDAILPWLHAYNWHRPHTALKNKAPISRLPLSGDNLLRLHT